MKKIVILISLLLLSGCCKSTPTKEVEEYFTKYQTNRININLDNIIDFKDYSEEQKEEFLNIMKNNYQNLVYTIKEETINADKAIVVTEIEVYDYSKKLEEIERYKEENLIEFMKDGYYSESKYIDYKIKKLKEVEERIKYTLEIPVSKVDKKWYVGELTKEYKEKINGIYKY